MLEMKFAKPQSPYCALCNDDKQNVIVVFHALGCTHICKDCSDNIAENFKLLEKEDRIL
jgi:hypothetical protein